MKIYGDEGLLFKFTGRWTRKFAWLPITPSSGKNFIWLKHYYVGQLIAAQPLTYNVVLSERDFLMLTLRG